ncbi:unnamed protein product, partial [Ectocarpus sp. 12 AP-2014]
GTICVTRLQIIAASLAERLPRSVQLVSRTVSDLRRTALTPATAKFQGWLMSRRAKCL